MSDHMKKRLNISGITSWNHDLPLASVNKVCGHARIAACLPINWHSAAIRCPDNQAEINALLPTFCLYLS
jgi:hypothetical protein